MAAVLSESQISRSDIAAFNEGVQEIVCSLETPSCRPSIFRQIAALDPLTFHDMAPLFVSMGGMSKLLTALEDAERENKCVCVLPSTANSRIWFSCVQPEQYLRDSTVAVAVRVLCAEHGEGPKSAGAPCPLRLSAGQALSLTPGDRGNAR